MSGRLHLCVYVLCTLTANTALRNLNISQFKYKAINHAIKYILRMGESVCIKQEVRERVRMEGTLAGLCCSRGCQQCRTPPECNLNRNTRLVLIKLQQSDASNQVAVLCYIECRWL